MAKKPEFSPTRWLLIGGVWLAGCLAVQACAGSVPPATLIHRGGLAHGPFPVGTGVSNAGRAQLQRAQQRQRFQQQLLQHEQQQRIQRRLEYQQRQSLDPVAPIDRQRPALRRLERQQREQKLEQRRQSQQLQQRRQEQQFRQQQELNEQAQQRKLREWEQPRQFVEPLELQR